MARPKKEIDSERIANLALIGCTNKVIANYFGVSADTLERRYVKVLREARADAEMRILAKTFQSAMKGNIRALELSLINRCGWANKPELVVNVTQNAGSMAMPLTAQQMRERLISAREYTEKFLASHGENGEQRSLR
jgi:hypothetical protein